MNYRKILFFPLFFLFLFLAFAFTHRSLSRQNLKEDSLKIHIITQKNGQGLETDYRLLKRELKALGHRVKYYDVRNYKKYYYIPEADVNIFIEIVFEEWLSKAKQNWFIPNPEWSLYDPALLDKVDLILCRTKEVERIFSCYPTFFLSFTSPDHFQNGGDRDYSSCFHLAGAGNQRGTLPLLEVWGKNPDFPPLTILKYSKPTLDVHLPNVTYIKNRIPSEELFFYQNQMGIHLSPSEVEGFGHCISEAMSTGAVVVTTDAPPMNEFIKDPRCLVKVKGSAQQYLATKYYVDPEELEKTLKNLFSLPKEELEMIGENNRKMYLEKRDQFKKNLKQLIDTYL